MLHPHWLVLHDVGGENWAYPLRWYALFVLCLALMIGQIDVTIVNIALPSIARDLGATTSQLQWVMDAYSIPLAGCVLFGGGLADRFGRKELFMFGLALFGVASLGGSFAREPWQLIAARAVMGLGAACFFPPALSLLAVLFAPKERTKAIAVWAATGGFATAVGPVLGGALVERFSWNAVFLVNVPVALVGIVAAALLVPRSRRPGAPRLDKIGALLSIVGLASLVFGVIEGPRLGWGSPATLAALGLGAGVLVAFALWEARHPAPMVDVRVFRYPGVFAGALGLVMTLFAMCSALFLLPLYLESARGESALSVGLALIPLGASFIVFGYVSSELAERNGVRGVLTVGLLLTTAGLAVLAFAAEGASLVPVYAGTVLTGLGAAFVASPGTVAVLNALPTEKAGDASAVNQITRQVGAAFGVAIVGTVLASLYARGLAPALEGLTTEEALDASGSIAGAHELARALGSGGEALRVAADESFARAFRVAMLVPAVMAACSAGLVAYALRDRGRS